MIELNDSSMLKRLHDNCKLIKIFEDINSMKSMEELILLNDAICGRMLQLHDNGVEKNKENDDAR